MSNEETLGLLRRWGDTLERAMFDEPDPQAEDWICFLQVLYPYSGVWHDQIVPRRDPYDISCLAAEHSAWVNFTSDHYTAIVRLYQAYRKLRSLRLCCKSAGEGNLLGRTLFDAHDAVTGFWEHVGSAIDNLGRCFDDAPVLNGEAGRGVQTIQANHETLSFAYRRRTQMIHYSIVPLGFDEEAIVFNERHFDEVKTNWTKQRYDPEWVDRSYFQNWKRITSELTTVWYGLRDELRRNTGAAPAIPHALLDPNRKMGDGLARGSGPQFAVQSQSTRKSGVKNANMPYWENAVQMHASSGSAIPPSVKEL